MLEVGPWKLGLCPSRLSPSGICLRPTSNRGMWLLIDFWWKDGPPFPRKVTDFSQWHRFGRILEKLGKKDTCLVSRTSRLYPGFDGTANCPHVCLEQGSSPPSLLPSASNCTKKMQQNAKQQPIQDSQQGGTYLPSIICCWNNLESSQLGYSLCRGLANRDTSKY